MVRVAVTTGHHTDPKSQCTSPWAHFHLVGTLRFMSDINQLSLPTPSYSVLVSISVFMTLSTVFHFINFPYNSPLSHSVLVVVALPC